MALTDQDRANMREVIDDYMRLWMEGEARACADLYTENGDALGVDGTFLTGRDAIHEYYEGVMSGKYSGFVVREMKTTGLRELGPGWALLDARWEVRDGSDDSLASAVRASFVFRDADGSWKIEAARMMVPAVVGR